MPNRSLESVIAAVHDERLRQLAVYWFERRGDRPVTRRCDIDPMQIGSVLPYIWLYEHELEGRRFRCRLAGEDVRAMYDMNIVGKYLDEFLLADNWPVIEAHYLAVINTPAIGHARGQVYRTSLHRIGRGERIVFPLSDEAGIRVTMLVGATIYHQLDSRQVTAPIERHLFPLNTPLERASAGG